MLNNHKVQLFWEGHENVHNLPYGFKIYLVNVKTIRTILHIFVAFLEKLSFIHIHIKSGCIRIPQKIDEILPMTWYLLGTYLSNQVGNIVKLLQSS